MNLPLKHRSPKPAIVCKPGLTAGCKKYSIIFLHSALAFLLLLPALLKAQDSTKQELLLSVNYYMNNNAAVYVMVNAKTKINKKFQPVTGVAVNLFLDSNATENLVSKLVTDEHGLAKTILPASLKAAWNSAPLHNFIAVSTAANNFESVTAEAAITKSKISIDTSSDGETKTITVKVSSFNGTDWVPVPDVEMKVGISRIAGSILPAGEEATYTTDSTGSIAAELKKLAMPGDEKGNIILTAKVEGNDQIGNLIVQKTVPWGVAVKADNSFFSQRALWSTRFRTPLWLLFMAYTIVIGVWGTIIYLVLLIIRIKKLGVAAA